jgi:Kinesin motor domain
MSRCDLTSRCQPCLVRASFALDAELVGAVQDVYGVRQGRLDEQLQRHLARTYTSLASVLLALKTAGSTQHVPFRDSQLTQWLRPSLQAASSLLLVATISPGTDAAAETLATLNYVSRFRTAAAGSGVLVRPSWASPAHVQETFNMPRSPSLSPRAALQSPDIYRGGIIQSQTMQQTSCSPLSLASPGGPVADWMWQGQPASPSSPDCGRTVLMLTPRGTHYQRVHTGPGSPAGAASPEQKDSRPDMAVPVDGVTDEQHEAFSQVLRALRGRRGGLC